MATTWRTLYRQHRAALLLGRLRWCAGLALLGALFTSGPDLLFAGPELRTRLGFALAYSGASLMALLLSGLRWGQRWIAALAAGYVLVLLGILAENFTQLPADVALAPAGFGGLIVGVTILLPFGVWAQGLVGAGALLGYAWVLGHTPATPNPGAVALVVSLVAVAIAAAQLVERYRAAWFERTWQQEQLVALARELSGDLEPAVVVAKVVEHGLRLVPADSAALALRDAAHQVYRVEAVAPAHAETGSEVFGLEVPEDFPALRQMVACEVLELPEEDPTTPLRHVYAAHGIRRVLYVTMRDAGEPLGMLSLARRTDRPFDAGERLLARGLADQAARALRTARLVADLRRANQLKTEFVSTMSHELRTPLNVILGYAEMVEDAALDAGGREAAACITRAGRELLELIDNTLEVGRIEAGRDEPQLEAVWLPAFWAELGQHCAALPRRDTVALTWEAAVPAVSLQTDPRRVTVVLRNLVGNALKFTADGSVHVAAALIEDRLILRVSDTGVGIRPEDHEVIFEMFRQADQSDTRQYGGTGLGLYIVRRLAAQLGGTVTLESAPGRGSVFTVTLLARTVGPRATAAASEDLAPHPTRLQRRLGPTATASSRG